jgi:hypothetical protein
MSEKSYEERNLNIEGTGMFYINTPNGNQIMISMRDGEMRHVDVHGMDEGQVNIFTEKKVSKETRTLTVPADRFGDGWKFKVVKLTVGE